MTSLTRYGVLFLVVFLNIPVIAAEPDSTSASPDTTESATLTEFDNGVRLLVLPRPDESLVQVDVYLSLRGAARNAGMAHMVEHLMFTSTENCPGGSVRDSLALLATYYQGLNRAYQRDFAAHARQKAGSRIRAYSTFWGHVVSRVLR